MKGLTPKQHEILQYIQNYIEQNQYSPSYREIMDHFSLASPGSIYKYIRTLKRKGALSAEKKCSRSLSLTEPRKQAEVKSEIELPLIGNVAAGYPIELFVKSQMLAIPLSMVHNPENTYLLRTQGDSFQDVFIQDGDLILVEARQEVQAGETILGLINQHDSIIKKYYPDGQHIRLESISQPPLTLHSEHIFIQGVLVGLLRAY